MKVDWLLVPYYLCLEKRDLVMMEMTDSLSE